MIRVPWSWRKPKAQKVVEEAAVRPAKFVAGDDVILRKTNPYKGSLRFKVPYKVLQATGGYILLDALNGTKGWFAEGPFEWTDGMGCDASDEYWDAMAAQAVMEKSGPG